MQLFTTLLVLLVILEHFFIMLLEMVLIDKPIGKKSFNLSDEFIAQQKVKVLFSNQGLYNGFLAVGLLWAYFFAPSNAQFQATVLFLSFVIIASIWGAYTANKAILIKQGLPALLALGAVLLT